MCVCACVHACTGVLGLEEDPLSKEARFKVKRKVQVKTKSEEVGKAGQTYHSAAGSGGRKERNI